MITPAETRPEKSAHHAVATRSPEPDRCRHSQSLCAEFTGCPTFQAATFVVADAQNHPIGDGLTCRHLTVGDSAAWSGRFYPRCGIGDAEQRIGWLTVVGSARHDVIRVLQEEFDQFARPYRRRLVEAKAAVQAAPDDSDRRRQLEQCTAEYLDGARPFLVERAQRFEAAGLLVEPLLDTLTRGARAWAGTRDVSDPGAGCAGRGRSASREQAFLGTMAPPAHRAAMARGADANPPGDDHPVFEASRLRVTAVGQPPRLAVRGEIDAANSDSLARWLLSMATGDDLDLDLAGVLFCDLGGARALVRAAQGLRDGAQLRLHRIPHQLERVLQLAGWASLDTLVVVADSDAEAALAG